MQHNLRILRPFLRLSLLLTGSMLGLPIVGLSQGGFVISNGTQVVVDGNASIVVVDGKWQNDGAFAAGTGLVRIEGAGSSANASIGGLSTAGNFYDLTLDKSANAAQLVNDIVVSHQLALTNAPFDLNTHKLTLARSDSDAVVRTAGYLLSEQPDNSSTVAWFVGTAPGLHTIPFGAISGIYIPVQFRVTAGNLDTVKVSTYPTNAANLPLPVTPTLVTNVADAQGADNSAYVVDRFWEINPTGPTGEMTLILNAQASEVGTITNLRAQRWDKLSNTWDAPLSSQISSPTSVQVTNVSKFSTFVMTQDLLPVRVEFLDFEAYIEGSRVVLKWLTASEINSDHFSVQRSADGYSFSEIGTRPAAGNSNVLFRYASEDLHPLVGRSFYRIVEYDIAGGPLLTEMQAVFFEVPKSMSYSVYPNPATPNNLHLRIVGGDGEQVTVRLADVLGQVRSSTTLNLDNDIVNYSFQIIPLLPKGNYVVWITGAQGSTGVKVVVQ